MLPLSFDEGYNLQVAYHLWHSSRYATWVSFPHVDSWISTGPAVLVPMAPFTAIHYLAPRIVMVAYSAALCFLIFRLVPSRLRGLVCIVLLCLSPLFPWFSLTVYGELPGFMWVLAGYYAIVNNHPKRSGVFMALAVLCKMQYMLAIIPLLFTSYKRKQLVPVVFPFFVIVFCYAIVMKMVTSSEITWALLRPRPDLLLERFSIVPFLLILVALKPKDVLSRLLSLFIVVWCSYMLFFAPSTHVRLWLPPLWASIILVTRDNTKIGYILICAAIIFFPRKDYLFSYSMRIEDQREAASWIKNKTVCADSWLRVPELSYMAQKPIRVTCNLRIENKFLKTGKRGRVVFENNGYVVYSNGAWEKKE